MYRKIVAFIGEKKERSNPLLQYYRMKNMISTLTSLMSFYLSFAMKSEKIEGEEASSNDPSSEK